MLRSNAGGDTLSSKYQSKGTQWWNNTIIPFYVLHFILAYLQCYIFSFISTRAWQKRYFFI